LIIKNLKILKGESLDLIEGSITIKDGIIKKFGEDEDKEIYDASGYLAMPCFINAHTHIGDSIAKDIGVGLTLKELVHPIYGLKKKILQQAKDDEIIEAMASGMMDMLRQGISHFCDFREGGKKGVYLIKEALKKVRGIEATVLGRVEYYFKEEELLENRDIPDKVLKELGELLEVCDGIGLSGANEYSDKALLKIGELVRSKGKLLAIHASESKETKKFSYEKTKMSEVERSIKFLKPNFLIHLTQADDKDLELVKKNGIGVVICPRANAELASGFPPVIKMLNLGLTVAIGSDNFMLNSPEFFKEMDYLLKISSVMEGKPYPLKPKEVLKMATINGGKLLNIKNSIDINQKANLLFIDLKDKNLEGSKDIIASLVKRGRIENIKAIMINGEWIYGRL